MRTASSPPPPFAARARSRRTATLLLCAVLLAAVLLNVGMGDAASVTPSLALRVIGGHIPVMRSYMPPLPATLRYVDSIVWEQRVPRAIGGAMVGVLLAMAGVAFQSLLMNPLADPYMVGVSSGSALGSVVVILFGGAGLLGGFATTVAAFAAGLITMTLVYYLSRINGRVSSQTFLLAGIVVGTFLWSIIQLMVSLAFRYKDPGRASAIIDQLLGSLQFIDWRSLALLVPFGLVGAWMLGTRSRELNMMTLGEESAAHQGVDTERFKRRVILAGSLVTAAAVSVAGIIAFVGMVVPHIARRLVGPDHRAVLPTSMLLGGIVIVLSDWLSRVYLNQLQIGVITSLVGAPVFCYLLRARIVTRW